MYFQRLPVLFALHRLHRLPAAAAAAKGGDDQLTSGAAPSGVLATPPKTALYVRSRDLGGSDPGDLDENDDYVTELTDDCGDPSIVCIDRSFDVDASCGAVLDHGDFVASVTHECSDAASGTATSMSSSSSDSDNGGDVSDYIEKIECWGGSLEGTDGERLFYSDSTGIQETNVPFTIDFNAQTTPNAATDLGITFPATQGDVDADYVFFCKVTDVYGNTDSCTGTHSFNDVTDPMITCPSGSTQWTNILTLPAVPTSLEECCGICSWDRDYTVPTPTDNCGIDKIECGPSGSEVEVTENTAETVALTDATTETTTCKATDVNGNEASCSFKSRLIDNTPPCKVQCPTFAPPIGNPNAPAGVIDGDGPFTVKDMEFCAVSTANAPFNSIQVLQATDACGLDSDNNYYRTQRPNSDGSRNLETVDIGGNDYYMVPKGPNLIDIVVKDEAGNEVVCNLPKMIVNCPE